MTCSSRESRRASPRGGEPRRARPASPRRDSLPSGGRASQRERAWKLRGAATWRRTSGEEPKAVLILCVVLAVPAARAAIGGVFLEPVRAERFGSPFLPGARPCAGLLPGEMRSLLPCFSARASRQLPRGRQETSARTSPRGRPPAFAALPRRSCAGDGTTGSDARVARANARVRPAGSPAALGAAARPPRGHSAAPSACRGSGGVGITVATGRSSWLGRRCCRAARSTPDCGGYERPARSSPGPKRVGRGHGRRCRESKRGRRGTRKHLVVSIEPVVGSRPETPTYTPKTFPWSPWSAAGRKREPTARVPDELRLAHGLASLHLFGDEELAVLDASPVLRGARAG